MYNSTVNIITVLNGDTIYFNGNPCLFTMATSQPLDLQYPPYGSLICESLERMSIGCTNPLFFDTTGILFNVGNVGRFNTWLGHFR